MTAAATPFVDQVLGWSAEDRAELAARLLDSLDPTVDSDVDAVWDEEIRRRLDDVAAGRETPVPWTAARAAILGDGDDAG